LPINDGTFRNSQLEKSKSNGAGAGEKMTRTRLRGLEIAGIQIGIEVPETCPWRWPDDVIAQYECLPRDPEVHVGVRVGKVGTDDLQGERYALGSWTFEVARQGEDWVLGLSRAGRREQLAFFDKDFRAGEIVVSSEAARRPGYPLQSPLDEWILLHRMVARGGLCLNATASADHGRARVRLGAADGNFLDRWTTPPTTIFGRNTLWVIEEAGGIRVYRTPWGDAMELQLGAKARILEFCQVEEAERPYRELLDSADAAEILVRHAVVPLCDEGLLERVMRNAQSIGERARVLRLGEAQQSSAPMAWRSPQLQGGFALPRGAV